MDICTPLSALYMVVLSRIIIPVADSELFTLIIAFFPSRTSGLNFSPHIPLGSSSNPGLTGGVASCLLSSSLHSFHHYPWRRARVYVYVEAQKCNHHSVVVPLSGLTKRDVGPNVNVKCKQPRMGYTMYATGILRRDTVGGDAVQKQGDAAQIAWTTEAVKSKDSREA